MVNLPVDVHTPTPTTTQKDQAQEKGKRKHTSLLARKERSLAHARFHMAWLCARTTPKQRGEVSLNQVDANHLPPQPCLSDSVNSTLVE